MAVNWSNWSGSVSGRPRRLVEPASEAELAEVLAQAAAQDHTVRVVGSGHSFTPLVATSGVLISLERLRGVTAAEPESGLVDVRAGTRLHELGQQALEAGLCLQNLGDVDVQTVGGALGTGTHGTGRGLANLSSRVHSLRVMTADGERVECTEAADAEAWRAARVSLGALGVVVSARLRLVPAYCLHERIERMSLEACLDRLPDAIDGHRHCEFFWYPAREIADLKTLALHSGPPDPLPDRPYERIGLAPHVLPSERPDRFNEMEYAVPFAAGLECVKAVCARIRARHGDVAWPVEYRTVRADDAFLSPASGRETVTISLHQDARLPHEAFFADLEPLFWEYGGRPHWGKVHSCRAERLARLYPEWERFHAVRRRFDPHGRFSNAHLRDLFGA
ncbi:MAG: FAD-binding protein [Proteobacteria bacterium]|nr:FAD-binding protein [Pseudomonadota bacterium]